VLAPYVMPCPCAASWVMNAWVHVVAVPQCTAWCTCLGCRVHQGLPGSTAVTTSLKVLEASILVCSSVDILDVQYSRLAIFGWMECHKYVQRRLVERSLCLYAMIAQGVGNTLGHVLCGMGSPAAQLPVGMDAGKEASHMMP